MNRNICSCRRKSAEWMNLRFTRNKKKHRGRRCVWQIDTHRTHKKNKIKNNIYWWFPDLRTLVTPGWANKEFFFSTFFCGSWIVKFFFFSTFWRRMIKKKKKKVRLVFVAAQKTFLTSQHLTKENARNTKSEDGSNWQGLVCGRRPAEAEETSLSSSI